VEILYRWFRVEFVKNWNRRRKWALISGCVGLTIMEYMLWRAKQNIITQFILGLSEKG
jgi:hypothetical protein